MVCLLWFIFFNHNNYKTKTCKLIVLVVEKIQEIKMQRQLEQKIDRIQLKPICSVCGNKKSRFISNDKKVQGILSSLGIRTPLSKVPLLNILF